MLEISILISHYFLICWRNRVLEVEQTFRNLQNQVRNERRENNIVRGRTLNSLNKTEDIIRNDKYSTVQDKIHSSYRAAMSINQKKITFQLHFVKQKVLQWHFQVVRTKGVQERKGMPSIVSNFSLTHSSKNSPKPCERQETVEKARVPIRTVSDRNIVHRPQTADSHTFIVNGRVNAREHLYQNVQLSNTTITIQINIAASVGCCRRHNRTTSGIVSASPVSANYSTAKRECSPKSARNGRESHILVEISPRMELSFGPSRFRDVENFGCVPQLTHVMFRRWGGSFHRAKLPTPN